MLLFAVLAPFVFALLLIVLAKPIGNKIGYFALPIPVMVFVYFLLQIPSAAREHYPIYFASWVPQMGINLSLSLDGLSLLFALLISGIGSLVFWYSITYLDAKERLANFYIFMLIFMGSMLGVVTANNLLIIYLFWELTSLSSFLLIGFWYDKERSRYGAQKALLITVLGGFATLAAFGLIGQIAGSYELSDVIAKAALIKNSPLYPGIVILVLLGAFTKSAQYPFHIWLPDAMEAPTPVSCYLHSATMVKAGIYLVARMTPILGSTMLWVLLISIVGSVTLFWGGYMALKQKDLKAVLAYSTVSQLGLVIALFGYGSEAAVFAAVFHLLNHSVFKGSLFLVTGMVDHATGTRDITKLRGLSKAMPITATLALFGTFAMAGLPPFNGFLSKELFFASSLETINSSFALGIWSWAFPVLAVIGSIFTFIYCMMIFFRVFRGGPIPDDLPHHPHEPAKGMLIPTALLASMTLVIAFFPNLFAKWLLAPAAKAVSGSLPQIHISFWHGLNMPLLMSAIVIGIGCLLYWRLDKIRIFLAAMPGRPSANHFYDWLIPGGALVRFGGRVGKTHMNGSLRDYLVYILCFFMLLFWGTVIYKDIFIVRFDNLAPIGAFEITWFVLVVTAIFTLVSSKKRVAGLFALSAIGYSVSFFFVLFRAPDLTLTQLLVETVSLVLFFLSFKYLPKDLISSQLSKKYKLFNALISIAVGFSVTCACLIAHSNKFYEPISDYYVASSKILAGGNNIVNVILVDFRGLDTLGEISVIVIAAIGVSALISLGKKHLFKEDNKDE
ncbi:MAG: proton-conducting transporter membrane subunit [Clostridia bacterium]|nr:proton-conducting transporter membrane subunit [Clostridia bacterium]MDD4798160.1 proton-conducting transporter membrane subunit [Clostridia bacterium]